MKHISSWYEEMISYPWSWITTTLWFHYDKINTLIFWVFVAGNPEILNLMLLGQPFPTIMLLPIWTRSVATWEVKWTKDKFLTKEFKLCACHPAKPDRYFSEVIWQAHLPIAYEFLFLVLFGTQSLPSIL